MSSYTEELERILGEAVMCIGSMLDSLEPINSIVDTPIRKKADQFYWRYRSYLRDLELENTYKKELERQQKRMPPAA